MLTVAKIIQELRYQRNLAKEHMDESRPFGTNTPGFNQDLGAYDMLEAMLIWAEENSSQNIGGGEQSGNSI